MAKRKQVKNACIHCQRACKKCDEERPCGRCVKYGLSASCVDSPRKERRAKRNSSLAKPSRRRQQIAVSDEDDYYEAETSALRIEQDKPTAACTSRSTRPSGRDGYCEASSGNDGHESRLHTLRSAYQLPVKAALTSTGLNSIRKRIAATVGGSMTLTAEIIRAAYPIGALAAVCAELIDKPMDAVHWLDRPQSPASSEIGGFEPVQFPANVNVGQQVFLQQQQIAPIPSRFPTPPDTPIYQWTQYPRPNSGAMQQSFFYPPPQFQHHYPYQFHPHSYPHQSKPVSTGQSPQKIDPETTVVLAKTAAALPRARSVSPLPRSLMATAAVPSSLNAVQPGRDGQHQ